uniref:Uncharacterized protein n=1 Tax=Magallana gigas TaxID=29159 RepID=K1PER6_MAGGI
MLRQWTFAPNARLKSYSGGIAYSPLTVPASKSQRTQGVCCRASQASRASQAAQAAPPSAADVAGRPENNEGVPPLSLERVEHSLFTAGRPEVYDRGPALARGKAATYRRPSRGSDTLSRSEAAELHFIGRARDSCFHRAWTPGVKAGS